MLCIEDFIEVMKSDGVQNSAIKNARTTLTQLNDFKSLEEVEYLDIVKFINHIREKHGYKESTVSLRKAYIKKYFKYHDRRDIYEKLEIQRDRHDLNPKDILNTEDVNYLLEHIDSPMYKALISFLYESGSRISEALAVKYPDDIFEVNVGYDLTITGKKTMRHNNTFRKMFIIESKAYIREWLMVRNTDSEYLFPVTDRAVGEWLNNLRKNLKFKKPINPHAFRHACATQLVKKGTQESYIRDQLGWSKTSNMIERYVHLAETDLQTYQLMQLGELPSDTPIIELVQPKETLSDRMSKLENLLISMTERALNAEPLAEAFAQLHPELMIDQTIRPKPQTDKTVEEIKGIMSDFENDNSPQFKEAKIEGEESRKIAPDKLTSIQKAS